MKFDKLVESILNEGLMDTFKNTKSRMFPNKKLEDLKNEYKRHARGLLRSSNAHSADYEDALDYYKRMLIKAGMSEEQIQDLFSEVDREEYEIRRDLTRH
jgi:hypothetical protein